jgi:hypothetical protein
VNKFLYLKKALIGTEKKFIKKEKAIGKILEMHFRKNFPA